MFSFEAKEVASIAVGGFGAMQKWEEFSDLLREVERLKPAIVVEIGFGRGGTCWAWSKIGSVTNLICIDLPEGPWGGEGFARTSATLQYIRDNSFPELSFIGGDSKDKKVYEKLEEVIGDEQIDFLMIDGDHSYEGVKKDYEIFSRKVRKGGLIAFHDICEHSVESGCEVKKFWDELREGKDYVQYVVEPLNWGGIGVIRV